MWKVGITMEAEKSKWQNHDFESRFYFVLTIVVSLFRLFTMILLSIFLYCIFDYSSAKFRLFGIVHSTFNHRDIGFSPSLFHLSFVWRDGPNETPCIMLCQCIRSWKARYTLLYSGINYMKNSQYNKTVRNKT